MSLIYTFCLHFYAYSFFLFFVLLFFFLLHFPGLWMHNRTQDTQFCWINPRKKETFCLIYFLITFTRNYSRHWRKDVDINKQTFSSFSLVEWFPIILSWIQFHVNTNGQFRGWEKNREVCCSASLFKSGICPILEGRSVGIVYAFPASEHIVYMNL